MAAPRHSIFREQAVKHYIQGRKKDILPSFSSIPVAIFVWVLLGSMLATGLVAWYVQVPMYLNAPGIMLSAEESGQGAQNGFSALLLFPPNVSTRLHVGQLAQVQVSTSGSQLTGEIAEIEPGTTSLAAALEHYGLSSSTAGASLSNQQVGVALIKLDTGASVAPYAGSPLAVRIGTGTQSLFSALTGIE